MDVLKNACRPRDEVIRVANLYIHAGVNVDNMKRFLRGILKTNQKLIRMRFNEIKTLRFIN